MKNFIIKPIGFTISLFSLVFMVYSCDELVDEDPISQVAAENFWQNNSDIDAGVIGIYDAMQKTYNNKHFIWGEFRADNFVEGSGSASANNLDLINNTIAPNNGAAVRWNNFYQIILRANLAIKNIPNVAGFNPERLGEAHIIRAYAYFDAIRVWGDVPLFTDPIESLEQDLFRSRTDADMILNEVIIPDMLLAEELINTETAKYRFSKNSIWAFQASVYLWLEDYDNAKIALEKIVNKGDYRLVDSPDAWQDLFINDIQPGGPGKIQDGPEIILSINYDLNDTDRSGIFGAFFAGLPSFYISPQLQEKWIEKFPVDSVAWIEKYPDTDPQLTFTTQFSDTTITRFYYGDWRLYFSREDGVEGDFEELEEFRLAKYNKSNYNPNLDDSDIILYRYADILYQLAEVENQLGNRDRAFEIINEIREARNLPLVQDEEFGTSIDEIEDFILDERQLELIGEGTRWWDLRRTDKVFEVLNPILEASENGQPLTEETIFFPIFFEHLLDNPELTQNPGY